MTRQTKTPAQRAQEALAVSERAVKRLKQKRDALRTELDGVNVDLDVATAERDYRAKHPALAEEQRPADPVTDTSASITASDPS